MTDERAIRCAIVVPAVCGGLDELQEPLGAEAICGFLRQSGITCSVFDRRIGADLSQIEAYKPTAVGFSVMTAENMPDALRTALALKNPDVLFFAGGLFVTQEYRRARALFPSWVKLIAGEGELAVRQLLEGKGPACAGPAPNEWAFASRDDLPTYLARGGVINLRSARGCRGSCAFCVNSGNSGNSEISRKSLENRGPETRSLPLIVDEMASLMQAGFPPIFNFTDDEFGDVSRIHELNGLLRQRGLKAAYSLELRPAVMTDVSANEWDELHRGGLCRVFTGLESINPCTLKKWNKSMDPEALVTAVAACKSTGILCETGYILFHSDSTPESVLEEAEWLHGKGLFSPKVALSRLMLYPGSRLHRESGHWGSAPCVLSPNVEEIYRRWSDDLQALFALWGKCALRLPSAACRSFLSGDGTELKQLNVCLESINEAAYTCVRSGTLPDTEALTEAVRKALP